jgi:3',5'-cyclic AMP phosphodiesterase CpdA
MFRLAHLSDVHLGPLPDISYRELTSKRVTGYVNWRRNRQHLMHDEILQTLVADLKEREPDHIAITGDLVNLALDAEINGAMQWLETLGDPDDISVVPGNHDAYVPGALDKACRAWGAWMTGDGEMPPVDARFFPYMRIRDRVAMIGTSTARATAPFMATGFFRVGQAHRLGTLLNRAGELGLFRVIMIHHPPVRDATARHKRLFGIDIFQRTIREYGAELVIHGHTHLATVNWIDGPDRPVPVVGVPSASQGPGGRRPASRYNLFSITGNRDDWHIEMTERGLSGHAMVIGEISKGILQP